MTIDPQMTASALYHAAKRQAHAAVTNQDPGAHPWLTLERAEEIQMVAAIDAAVSEERARCLGIAHQRLPDRRRAMPEELKTADQEAPDAIVRACVDYLKRQFLGWRIPPVELPPDSLIEEVVKDIRNYGR